MEFCFCSGFIQIQQTLLNMGIEVNLSSSVLTCLAFVEKQTLCLVLERLAVNSHGAFFVLILRIS